MAIALPCLLSSQHTQWSGVKEGQRPSRWGRGMPPLPPAAAVGRGRGPGRRATVLPPHPATTTTMLLPPRPYHCHPGSSSCPRTGVCLTCLVVTPPPPPLRELVLEAARRNGGSWQSPSFAVKKYVRKSTNVFI
jgi:hypothetical protein